MTSRKKGKQQSWRKRCQSGENPWKMGSKMRLVNNSENPEKRMQKFNLYKSIKNIFNNLIKKEKNGDKKPRETRRNKGKYKNHEKWQNRMKNTIILKISRVQKECVLQKERIEMDSLWRARDEKT